MVKTHFDKYFSQEYNLAVDQESSGEIITGSLTAKESKREIPIINKIPRFVTSSNYADNFGLQWNTFHATQLDSVLGKPITKERFLNGTKWKLEDLRGKTILEAGSGAGRFTEILLQAGAHVVSFDYSIAVDANHASNSSKGDLFLFQGDTYSIPFPDRYFDFVFCYGVLQHLPEPERAYKCLFSKLKSGGKISIDYY